MPRLDSNATVITRIAAVDKGEIPQMSNTPKYLVIRGISTVGQQEILISQAAARELLTKLTERLPVDDSE